LPHKRGRDRIDIKKDNSVIGDTSTSRISIEGATQFNRRIEIDPGQIRTAGD